MAALLVIDDDPDLLELMRLGLGQDGRHQIVTLSSAMSAQLILRETSIPLPDAIVLDLQLPGMDGLDLLAWLRTTPRTRDLPVVMLTAQQAPMYPAAAAALDVDGYLVKPCDFAALEQLLLEAIQRRAEAPLGMGLRGTA